MKRFTSYFHKEETAPGYCEGQYSQGSVFILSETWNGYTAGSEFVLTENELPDVQYKIGVGISKGVFKDPKGNFIEIGGSRRLLENILKFKPEETKQPDSVSSPVVIIEKEVVHSLPQEIPLETIKQVVQEMIIAGPKGERGPEGPPGKTIIIEKPQENTNKTETVSGFDFGSIEKDSSPSLSIDLGGL